MRPGRTTAMRPPSDIGNEHLAVTPEEVLNKWADSFKVVSHPVRLLILLMLYASDRLSPRERHSLTFTEIRDLTRAASDVSLVYHLNSLMEGGFIAKKAHMDGESRVYPIYTIATTGEEFLTELGLTGLLRDKLQDLQRQLK